MMQFRELFLLIVVTCLAIGVYLMPISDSVLWNRIAGPGINSRYGFPLDDAWIHQTYARNLALHGEWAFIPGKPSGGSTSPLWSMLLSPAHLIFDEPYFWTYLLGGLSLLALGIVGESLFRKSKAQSPLFFPCAGLFLVGEWHMVWAALSGMETILLSLFVMIVFWFLLFEKKRWFIVGLLIGVSVWVRPDGITLLGLAGLALLYAFLQDKARRLRFFIRTTIVLLSGFLVVFLPYLVFNEMVTGQLWPNTFYAKQAEYAVQREISLLFRLFNLMVLPSIGAGALLLPGFLYGLIRGIRNKDFLWLAGAAWWLGYTLIYALRLPVTYQHGRYLMPAMPIYFVLGLIGSTQMLSALSIGRVQFVLKNTWMIGTVGVWLGFYFLGMNAYARDVAIIETEMVRVAKWVAAELPSNSIIAAHDIGALGYFGKHNLVDLAGLISPEVIPFIRDEYRLAQYLDEQKVEYLVTFPSWYPKLVKNRQVIFSSGGNISIQSGGENMQVFKW